MCICMAQFALLCIPSWFNRPTHACQALYLSGVSLPPSLPESGWNCSWLIKSLGTNSVLVLPYKSNDGPILTYKPWNGARSAFEKVPAVVCSRFQVLVRVSHTGQRNDRRHKVKQPCVFDELEPHLCGKEETLTSTSPSHHSWVHRFNTHAIASKTSQRSRMRSPK